MRLLCIHTVSFTYNLSLIHTNCTCWGIRQYVGASCLCEVSLLSTYIPLPVGILSNAIQVYCRSAVEIRHRYDMVRLLLERGANVHYDRNEPLAMAIHNNALDIVELLFKYGAYIHARQSFLLDIHHMYLDTFPLLRK